MELEVVLVASSAEARKDKTNLSLHDTGIQSLPVDKPHYDDFKKAIKIQQTFIENQPRSELTSRYSWTFLNRNKP